MAVALNVDAGFGPEGSRAVRAVGAVGATGDTSAALQAGVRRATREVVRRWLNATLGAALVAGATNATALGLGTAILDSGLGEPLRLSLPVTLQPDEEIGCIQVRARGNDLPSVFNTRSNVVRAGGQARIEITSALPVNEPAIGLVVSVGCTSPVAREFSLLLDPPFIPAQPAATALAPRSVVEPSVPRGIAQSTPSRARPARRATSASSSAVSTTTRAPRLQRPPRTPRVRPPASLAAPVSPPLAAPRAATPAPATAAAATAPSGRDRLSIAPVEPGPAAPLVAPTTPAAATPVPSALSTTAATTAATAATTAVPTAAPTTDAATAPTITPDAEAAAREQALTQQQAALEAQIKSLSDQIALLRVQTTTLVARNQTLEDSAFSPTLVWLLIALAVLSIIVAGWMAWRYTQLRRQLEGSPWWTANTMAVGPSSGTNEGDLAPLEAGTRVAARPVPRAEADARAAAPAAPVVAAPVPERSRPMTRSQNRPPAIETDFTVSDIEAAMATVRTVSPPRRKEPNPEDSDFHGLGGPTLPSPFTDPPPPAPSGSPEAPAKFVDLDIPPMSRSPAAVPGAPTAILPTEVEPVPLDFKLDIPATDFDPLATTGHKNTEVLTDQPGDFGLQSPTSLDFELPSATQIMALSAPEASPTPRHGSTALDNLFASDTGALGPDTILDLDDRHGSPLSTTEVDRLTGGDSDAAEGIAGMSVQARMARFADLMNQVDDVAQGDPLRAIAQLRQFVLRDENIPTLLWLRLFDLYKAVEKRMVYEALSEHFARRYHRPMVGWTEQVADRVLQTPLSQHGELDREIEDAWGTEAGLQRLQALLCGRDQPDAIVFNEVLQRDLLDAAKIFLLDRDSSISRNKG